MVLTQVSPRQEWPGDCSMGEPSLRLFWSELCPEGRGWRLLLHQNSGGDENLPPGSLPRKAGRREGDGLPAALMAPTPLFSSKVTGIQPRLGPVLTWVNTKWMNARLPWPWYTYMHICLYSMHAYTHTQNIFIAWWSVLLHAYVWITYGSLMMEHSILYHRTEYKVEEAFGITQAGRNRPRWPSADRLCLKMRSNYILTSRKLFLELKFTWEKYSYRMVWKQIMEISKLICKWIMKTTRLLWFI